MLPQDPFMLLSFVNMKLRDEFKNLDELCSALDLDRNSLIEKLSSAGFEYNPVINQFR